MVARSPARTRRGTRPGGGLCAETSRLRRGACPAPNLSDWRHRREKSIRRPGTHQAGEPTCTGATGDRRRPAVCPFAASGPPISPTGATGEKSPFVGRARIRPANRHAPAQRGIAAGLPCAPTRARPTNLSDWRHRREKSIRRPGTHQAGEPTCTGATGDRRRPAVCPYACPAHQSIRLAPPARKVHSSAGHASGRRTDMHRRNGGSPPARRVPLRGVASSAR